MSALSIRIPDSYYTMVKEVSKTDNISINQFITAAIGEKLTALQTGEASKVVPIDKLSVVITLILAIIFLHENVNAKSIIGSLLITAGTLCMVL